MAIIPKNSIIDDSPTSDGKTRSLKTDGFGNPLWDTAGEDSVRFMKEYTSKKSMSIDPYICSTSLGLATGAMYLLASYLDTAASISTLAFIQNVQGVYTASNNNKLGIYGYNSSSQDFTKLAETANTGTLFKGTAGDAVSASLTASVNLMPGWYWLAMLYNSSAQTTGPTVYGTASVAGAGQLLGGLKSIALTAQTDLPATFNLSSAVTSPNMKFMMMY